MLLTRPAISYPHGLLRESASAFIGGSIAATTAVVLTPIITKALKGHSTAGIALSSGLASVAYVLFSNLESIFEKEDNQPRAVDCVGDDCSQSLVASLNNTEERNGTNSADDRGFLANSIAQLPKTSLAPSVSLGCCPGCSVRCIPSNMLYPTAAEIIPVQMENSLDLHAADLNVDHGVVVCGTCIPQSILQANRGTSLKIQSKRETGTRPPGLKRVIKQVQQPITEIPTIMHH